MTEYLAAEGSVVAYQARSGPLIVDALPSAHGLLTRR
jgi:hypothetical protein